MTFSLSLSYQIWLNCIKAPIEFLWSASQWINIVSFNAFCIIFLRKNVIMVFYDEMVNHNKFHTCERPP